MTQPPVGSGTALVNGIAFHYLEQGAGPLVLCVHGFPDTAHTFDLLLPRLAEAGYRAVAPYTRGYAPTALAPDGRYDLPLLADDVLGLIDALDGPALAVVGHDWGGMATYAAAALDPTRMAAIVTLGVARSVGMSIRSRADYDRLKSAWHAWFFQMPFAETAVADDDFAFLEYWWHDASPSWRPPPTDVETVKVALRVPGVLTAALDYYRHTFDPNRRDVSLAAQYEALTAPITIPTLGLHGDTDRPGTLEAFEAMSAAAFPGGLERTVVPGVGHFLHREEPALVADRVVEFLQSIPARNA